MEKIILEGGRSLHGQIRAAGAKNAALPILIALPIGDDQSDVVTGGGETPALLQEHPGVVSSVDRCQLSDPTHEHGVPAVGPISMAP